MLKINRCSCTRIVLEFKSFVVKIPNFTYSWEHFLKGLVGNISESKTWKWCSEENRDLICPVYWCMWGGWILIMAKADVGLWENQVRSLPDDFNGKSLYQKWIAAGFGGDDKCDNYGYYKNRLVKIDYA